MRERIASAISKSLEKSPNSKNLQRQLTLLSRANITTMHSFCLDVIKNYFYTIDLDPSFRIGDETEAILMKNEIIEELFEEYYEEDNEDFKKLIEAYSSSKGVSYTHLDLLDAAGIYEYEKVHIVDIENGARFETYTIAGERGTGMICLHGAAARCVQVGDKIILMAYCDLDTEEVKNHKPKVVFVNEENKISRITNYEKHGQLSE